MGILWKRWLHLNKQFVQPLLGVYIRAQVDFHVCIFSIEAFNTEKVFSLLADQNINGAYWQGFGINFFSRFRWLSLPNLGLLRGPFPQQPSQLFLPLSACQHILVHLFLRRQ